jgi:UDP-N-acetyl-D-mannosaminuronic acid transferase (WecB/TagA/CpsF family)
VPRTEGTDGKPEYLSTAILQRLGGLRIPVDVRVAFDDGSIEWLVWDGEAREKTLSFAGPRRIVSVEIDPAFRNRLDLDMINNSRTVETQGKGLKWYAAHCLTRVQHFMEGLTLFM